MTDASSTTAVYASVDPHYSDPWPPSYFVRIYDNEFLVEDHMMVIPTRRYAEFKAKRLLKKYEKTRFVPSKPESTIILL